MSAAPEQIGTRRGELGLDRPIAARYPGWVQCMVRGDFGRCLPLRRPVGALVIERLPATLELTGLAFLIGLGGTIPLGMLAVLYRGRLVDRPVTVFT